MPKKKKTAESINRQLMNTVRNKERGTAETRKAAPNMAGTKTINPYYAGTGVTKGSNDWVSRDKKTGVLSGAVNNRAYFGEKAVNKSIKSQSRAAKKASGVKKGIMK